MGLKRILSVSRDKVLLSIRGAMLTQGGYEVCSVLGDAIAHCKNGGFDLLLIGHSIPDAEVNKTIAAWRQQSDAPIVLIMRCFDRGRDGVAHYVDSLQPDELMQTVVNILEPEKHKNAASQ